MNNKPQRKKTPNNKYKHETKHTLTAKFQVEHQLKQSTYLSRNHIYDTMLFQIPYNYNFVSKSN